MNRKSNKRNSILKKNPAPEESSPTFTKLNRRISFSGKKSIKEFTSDDNKMTIWGNSYEESAEMAASQHTIGDSMISQTTTTTMCAPKQLPPTGVAKENEQIKLRNRTVLKRKSNVLKVISPVQPIINQKDITPNIETVEMDISINETVDKKFSVAEFLSPKKSNKIVENATPVPPEKVTKFNGGASPVLFSHCLSRRISDELPSDSYMNTFDATNFTIPSRIHNRDDINITYAFNLSEFDFLPPKQTSATTGNMTSFATKIDRINFSNEEEEEAAAAREKKHASQKDDSVMLKVQNPQIEQMKLTGTIVDANDQNLDISIEISNAASFKTLASTTEEQMPAKLESPKSNPVLEMYKKRNELKRQMAKQFEEKLQKECIVPFKPATFEDPFRKYSTINSSKISDMDYTTKGEGSNNKMNRQTIYFAQDGENLEMSVAETKLSSQNTKKTSGSRGTIYYQNVEVETSFVETAKSTVTTTTKNEKSMQGTKTDSADLTVSKNLNQIKENAGATDDLDISVEGMQISGIQPKRSSTKRGTIYFENNDLDTTLPPKTNTSFKNKILLTAPKSRDPIHFPNQELETSLIDKCENVVVASNNSEKHNRGTIYYQNRDLETSFAANIENTIQNPTDLDRSDEENNKSVEPPIFAKKRNTIYFPNQDVDISTIESGIDENANKELKDLDLTMPKKNLNSLIMGVSYPKIPGYDEQTFSDSSKNSKSNLNSLITGMLTKPNDNRRTIHFTRDDDLEMSVAEDGISKEARTKSNSRGTIYFVNKDVDTTLTELAENLDISGEECEPPVVTKANLNSLVMSKISAIADQDFLKNRETKKDLGTSKLKVPQVIEQKGKASKKAASKRTTICFENQEIDTSVTENSDAPPTEKPTVKNRNRGTIHFANENNLDVSDEEIEMPKSSTLTKRSTIFFSNQELKMSTIEDNSPSQPALKSNAKRGTINFGAHGSKLDVSDEEVNQKPSMSKRGTICFSNQEVETFMHQPELLPSTRSFIDNANRETIHFGADDTSFPNHEMDSSKMEKSHTYAQKKSVTKNRHRGTIYFGNQHNLDVSNEEIDLQKSKANRGTIFYPNQEMEASIIEQSDPQPSAKSLWKNSNRGTIHYGHLDALDVSDVEIELPNSKLSIRPNQELQSSRNINVVDDKMEVQQSVMSKRSTICFPNQELETSEIAETEPPSLVNNSSRILKVGSNQDRKTIYFDKQLSLDESGPNLEMLKFETEEKSGAVLQTAHQPKNINHGTIHFGQQTNLDISAEQLHAPKSTKRETICFQNQELESSAIENYQTSLEFENPINNNPIGLKKNFNRGTIHFVNQSETLDISLRENEIEIPEPKRGSERGTICFKNHEIDTSMIEMSNFDTSMGDCETAETNMHPSKSSQRGQIHFESDMDGTVPGNGLDLSMLRKVYPKTPAHNRKRDSGEYMVDELKDKPQGLETATIYYHDKTLDITKCEATKNRASVYCLNDELDTSDIEPKIEPMSQPVRGTIYFQNQELDTSKENNSEARTLQDRENANTIHDISMECQEDDLQHSTQQIKMNHFTRINAKKKLFRGIDQVESSANHLVDENKENLGVSNNRKTIHFHNQDLETSKSIINYMKTDKSSQKMTQRGTIHFQQHIDEDDNLDVSGNDFGEMKLSQTKVHDDAKSRGDDHDLEISEQPVKSDQHHPLMQFLKRDSNKRRETMARQSRLEELDKTNNLNNTDQTNLNMEDLNMTGDFDERHIKQQSTMTNLNHIVQFLSKKHTNDKQLNEQYKAIMSDGTKLDTEEMDFSGYQPPEHEIANDSSSLKLFGPDSTYSANNTQALCNLDPKRIFCVSKFDAMNAKSHHSSNVTLTPRQKSMLPVPIKKSMAAEDGDGTINRLTISAYHLPDDTTIQDVVARDNPNSIQNITTDLLEFNSNMSAMNKTRQETCHDYINLIIGRLTNSTTTSPNIASTDQIDQTTLNLIETFDDDDADDVFERSTNQVYQEGLKYVEIDQVNHVNQDVDNFVTRKKITRVPVLDLTKYKELLNQPSFQDIANEYNLKNLKNLKRVSELHEPMAGPDKPSLRFLMNNYREQLMKKCEQMRRDIGIIPFLPLIPKISTLLQNKLAERPNYWTCNDTYYLQGILTFSHYRVPCIQIKMLFDAGEETEFGELQFTSIVPMMSKTKVLVSTFELIQHLQFFKRIPSEMKNMCRQSNEILEFLENLDSKIISKNYEDIKMLKDIVVKTNAKIWHKNETGECGITKSIINNRKIYDIIIRISDFEVTDISDVTIKPQVRPTEHVMKLTRGLDFIKAILYAPKDYFKFS